MKVISMSDNVELSVIIPTLNRQECLLATLRSIIETQSGIKYEVIIVDQSDAYDKKEFSRQIKLRFGDVVPCIYQNVTFKSLPRARNAGVNLARGRIILFLDDDIRAHKNLFAEHMKIFTQQKDVGGIGGRVIEYPDSYTNTTKVGGYVGSNGRCFRNFSAKESGFVNAVPGGNMSFRREVVRKVGRFDENYIGTSELEETDYSYRTVKAGYKLFYNASAVMDHLVCPIGGCRAGYLDRECYKMHNVGYFFAIHKARILFPYFFLFQCGTMVKRLLSHNQPVSLKDLVRLVKALARGYFITSKQKNV